MRLPEEVDDDVVIMCHLPQVNIIGTPVFDVVNETARIRSQQAVNGAQDDITSHHWGTGPAVVDAVTSRRMVTDTATSRLFQEEGEESLDESRRRV